MNIKSILLTVTITISTPIYPIEVLNNDTIRIQTFGEESGFSTTVVQHVIQDRQGYIWLATWDGLRR